jgi:dihydrofolate reductase
MKINAIAAISENGAIGFENKLLWSLPNDLNHFKKLTLNQIVLMGRKTFESISKPLKSRENWVLSNSKFDRVGTTTFKDFESVLNEFETVQDKELFIIGGTQIYLIALPFCSRLYLTKVHCNIEQADAFFPNFNASKEWVLVSEQLNKKDALHLFDYTFQVWDRK